MVNGQYRCPSGDEGKQVISSMNEHHAPLTDWALSNLPDIDPKWILDIGCGGGMLIGKLAERYPEALIDGVDISAESVKATADNNPRIAAEGRLHVLKASVSDFPYDKGTFDLVTAVETYFFWPNPELDIFSAAERLVPGGVMMIASEAYPDPEFDEVNNRHSEEYGMKLLPNERLQDIMSGAGLRTEFFTVKEKNWVVFIGKKE